MNRRDFLRIFSVGAAGLLMPEPARIIFDMGKNLSRRPKITAELIVSLREFALMHVPGQFFIAGSGLYVCSPSPELTFEYSSIEPVEVIAS